MAPFVHVVCLVAAIVTTAAAVFRSAARPTLLRALTALASVPLTLFVAMLGVHMCGRGTPFVQWLVPGGLCALALLLVGPPIRRFGLAVALEALGTVLTLDFASRVHGDDWIGHPGIERLDATLADSTERAVGAIKQAPEPVARGFYGPVFVGKHGVAGWYTPLTGFYSQQEVRLQNWSEGGTHQEARASLEPRAL